MNRTYLYVYFFQILELTEESITTLSSDTTKKLSTAETKTSTPAGNVNYRKKPTDPELLDYYPAGKLIFYAKFALVGL